MIENLPDLAGPPEPPARIHGDLWSGNVLWTRPARRCSSTRPRTADTARPTSPCSPSSALRTWARILAAYRDETPLADGWRARVPLHQLHPLLVHVCLYGEAYRGSLLTAAAGALELA